MDPDPDPTFIFSDFKDAKKNPIFFPYNLLAGTLSSILKINIFDKILCENFIFASIISVRSTPL
jgi:hypothetical protein